MTIEMMILALAASYLVLFVEQQLPVVMCDTVGTPAAYEYSASCDTNGFRFAQDRCLSFRHSCKYDLSSDSGAY